MEKLLKVPLLLVPFIVVSSYAQEDCHCPIVEYLQFGGKGTIQCRCDHFSVVSWYRSKEDYDAGGIPFIKYDNLKITGTGKTSGQFDLELDGSLIINNVSMVYHEMEYFCVFFRDTEGQTVTNRVRVEVIVYPDPLYPVLNGHRNHQYLYLDKKRQGTLYCSMEGVHPKVNLSITVVDQGQQDGVYLERGDERYSANGDNAYNVQVTYNYAADLSVQTSIFQCNVTGDLSHKFSEVAKAEINFPPGEKAFPVIKGGIDPEHILLEVNRTGEIECSILSSDPETSLVWRVVDPFLEDKIIFYNRFSRALPTGDMFIVSSKCSFVVEDEDLDRLTVQCQVTGGIGHQYQNATKVELLFPKKAQILTPVIDECNGKYDICMLKVQCKWKLTCRLKNPDQSVELQWNIFDGHQWKEVPSQKMEGAEDVVSLLQYEMKKSQATMIAECYTVAGDKIPGASSKVVLFTEGDCDSDNRIEIHVLIGLSLLTICLVIFFGLIDVKLSYFNRKVYKLHLAGGIQMSVGNRNQS